MKSNNTVENIRVQRFFPSIRQKKDCQPLTGMISIYGGAGWKNSVSLLLFTN